jgi:hypothetical protein
MEVRLDSPREGAARATGAVVIIDVLRTFTTAAATCSRGGAKTLLAQR